MGGQAPLNERRIMGRRSRGEAERDAYRIIAPVAFWLMAWMVFDGFQGVGRDFATGAAGLLVLVGACFLPRAIRTIRDLL